MLRRAAERFRVAVTTASRWASRYREEGPAGMVDRSSRPHHSPTRTPTPTERRIINVRVLRRWGPARIAYLLGLNVSTVHRVLTRYGLAKLRWLDRPTGQAVRRMESAHPGDLVHIDVKKLGKIPAGGGWRMLGRTVGKHNARADRSGGVLDKYYRPMRGYQFLHTAIDAHSRLAYSELLADERQDTAAAFWLRANAWFTECGIAAAPHLVEFFVVGVELAGQFLVTAGDNSDRIHNEAAFAKLCGVAPQPASSGRTTGRHRLSRSGDRAANSALYIVTIVRLRHHEPTRAYVERRTNEN
jgi:Transposase IS116/IS110/IS902 family/Homeodomain-like domain/Integrase core domain